MKVLSKNILIILHNNINNKKKKYTLTKSGIFLIDEIANFVKDNFKDAIIYSSSELINVLTAKAIFEKTNVLTNIDKNLDNNKCIYNDEQLNINVLNDNSFINEQNIINIKSGENYLETYLRVKNIFKHIIVTEKKKNIIFIVCKYVGECILNCLNTYKINNTYKNDTYIYDIKFNIKKVDDNYQVQVFESTLLKSINILKRTFYKLRNTENLVQTFNFCDCCYFQEKNIKNDIDEEFYNSEDDTIINEKDTINNSGNKYLNTTFHESNNFLYNENKHEFEIDIKKNKIK